MDFNDALSYLLGLGHETLAIKLGLQNTTLLLDQLENPQHAFASVQIAGTNGKGSTAAFLDSIARAAGVRTGLYTSPHLESITERVSINGVEVARADFARYATTVRDAATQLLTSGKIEALPTFFEQLTALALVAFREAGVELAILETGLGGRLDATTAVNADFCAITEIAFDHEEYLGSSLPSIAAEKAAIIHHGSHIVIAAQRPEALEIILQRCTDVGVRPVWPICDSTIINTSVDGRYKVTFQSVNERYEGIWLGLRGRHQIKNAGVAIQLAEVLRTSGFDIPHSAILEGIEEAFHAGRLELITGQPAFILDGAHNPAGALALRTYLEEFGRKPLTILFGAMRDKRVEEIVKCLFPMAENLILTTIQNPRSASLETLRSFSEVIGRDDAITVESSHEGIKQALKKTALEGMICITGSLYLIGETRSQIRQLSCVNA